MEKFDLVVVGGGKAGKSLAMLRAKKGDRVLMVERGYIGGTCINVACIPTKTLVSSARVLETVRASESYGVDAPDAREARVALEGLRRRKEGVVGAMIEAHKKMFAAPNLDFVLGTAKFTGPRTVEILLNSGETRLVEGEKVLINTGTVPFVPPIEGLDTVDYWTSNDLLNLTEIPEHLAILGGGVIGVEMASLMATFGARVTLLEAGEHILGREDSDVAAQIAQGLENKGVTILTGARAEAVRRQDNEIIVETSAGEVKGSNLLVALGRRPVTENLGLDIAGVELDERGFVRVNDQLETNVPGVYSAGDVAGSPQFTHVSWNDFRVLRDLFDGKEATTKGRLVPWAVFVTPELGRVGMGEEEARAKGFQVRVAKTASMAVPRAKTSGHVEGFYKVVVDAQTDRILGAAIIGDSASEVITSVQMAMLGGLRWQQVRDAVIAHPTMAEGLNIVLDAMPALD